MTKNTNMKKKAFVQAISYCELLTIHINTADYSAKPTFLQPLRECLCKSGLVDFAGATDLAHFLCVVRHSCTYTKTTIRLIGSLYFSEFYGN